MTISSFIRTLLIASILCICVPAVAEVHGVLRVVKGDVQIKSGNTGIVSKAKLGQEVYPKDTIITGKEARAKIVMIDNNELNISPESHIEIQNYEYNPTENKKDVLLNVLYGKVRSKVEQKYDGKTSKFQVKTPSAVAGVRGTDFMTGYNPTTKQSQVVTFRGAVEFGLPGANGTIQNSVSVTPGKMAQMNGSAAPAAPSTVPPAQLVKIDQSTKAEAGPGGSAPASDPRAPAGGDKGDKSGSGNGSGSGASNGTGAAPPASATAGDNSGGGSPSGAAASPNGNSASGGGASGSGSTSPSTAANAPTSGDSSRGPANVTGSPTGMGVPAAAASGGSMLIAGSDLASAPGGTAMLANIPKAPSVPSMGAPSVTVPTAINPTTCQFCNQVIQSGNSKLTVNVAP